MNADRTLLTDTHWALLAPLLPGRVGRRGVVAKDNRGFVEAVLWVGRTGLPWRDLPPHLGQWHRVFVRFSRWRTRGVWAQVLAALQAAGQAVPSPRQRQVYEAVLAVMDFAKTRLVPGTEIEEYHRQVGEAMEQQLIGLDLLNAVDVKNQDPAAPLYKKYFMHGTSHYLGLDVHDVGYKYRTFEAGMVYTVEPGIYIPEEGLGIRLENDILLTANGNEDLMANIPLKADDIEKLMSDK